MAGHRTAPIDIAIADSNPLMLGALSEVFDRDGRFSLVFTTKSAEAFLETAARVQVAVGIIDWALPTLGGEELIGDLRLLPAPPRVIVYASGGARETPRRAMAAGAAGFCSRDDPVEQLLDITASVAAGRMVFPFLDIRDLNADPIDRLTQRERALLGELARGLSNKEIATGLDISVNTVKFHLRNLFEKLAVSSRAQAIALYYDRGAVRRPPDGDAEG